MRYLLVLLLAGCASAVTPVGGDVFMATSSGVAGNGSGAEQKARAYDRAHEHCAALAKTLEPISDSDSPAGFGRAPSAEVRFRCR